MRTLIAIILWFILLVMLAYSACNDRTAAHYMAYPSAFPHHWLQHRACLQTHRRGAYVFRFRLLGDTLRILTTA